MHCLTPVAVLPSCDKPCGSWETFSTTERGQLRSSVSVPTARQSTGALTSHKTTLLQLWKCLQNKMFILQHHFRCLDSEFDVKVDHGVLCTTKKDLRKGTGFTQSKLACLCHMYSQKNCRLASANPTHNTTPQASAPTEKKHRFPPQTKLATALARLFTNASEIRLTSPKWRDGCCTCVCLCAT